MWLLRRNHTSSTDRATSDLLERIQRLEHEHTEFRNRVEADRQLRILAAQISNAGTIGPMIGEAIERFSASMRAPIRRGRAGGLARARTAWRFFDGTFMPESEKLEVFRLEYERYAAGGRARARSAHRDQNGTFLPAREGKA